MANQEENYDDSAQKETKKKGNQSQLVCDEEVVIQKFENFQKSLIENDIIEANTQCDVFQCNKEQAEEANKQLKKGWKKSLQTLKEYTDISEEISLKLDQETINFQGNISNSKTLFTGDLETAFSEALKCIKDSSKKALAVVESTNQLTETIKDTCNQKELKQYLSGGIDLLDEVNKIKCKAEDACEQAGKNFETSVKVAGVKSLINIESLEAAGTEIKNKVADFKLDVDNNITSSQLEVTTKQKEYFESIQSLCDKENQLDYGKLLKQGLTETKIFVDPENCRSVKKTIDEIWKEAEEGMDC